MKFSRAVTISTIFFFIFFTLIGANPGLLSDTANDDLAIAKLLTEAENNYQNGKFKEAIKIYEQIIIKLNNKKELVKTKQKLFRTMVSLALTYFTIQETEKSKIQLKKLVKINPNQEIDEEVYPPQFMNLFKEVQKDSLGELIITSTPSDASVTIDNKSVGNTPLRIKKFPKGDYIVTLAKKGYKIATRKINVIQDKSGKVEVILEKSGEKKVVEKEGVRKKKKKTSPLLLIGGAVAIAAILLLVLKKKDKEPEEVTISRQFNNDVPVPIAAFIPAYSLIEVSGITGTIKRIEYSVTIAHPRIEDLAITLIGTDNRTLYNIWNKGPHEDNGKVFTGTTEIFNSVQPNGSWKVTINNSGQRNAGEIRKWSIKVFFTQ